jgi:ankyrin repeat protein
MWFFAILLILRTTNLIHYLKDNLKISIYLFLLGVVSVNTSIGMSLEKSMSRTVLLRTLEHNDIDNAAAIMKNRPSVLEGHEDDPMLIDINCRFANAFYEVSTKHIFKYNYFKQLVHCGFDLNMCDQAGVPLLSRVIVQNDGEKYLDLLKAGVRVNVWDKYGNSPLTYAVQEGNQKTVENLLSYGAIITQNDVNIFPSYVIYSWMEDLLKKQKCFVCKTREHNVSTIPCVNRHLGNFICCNCYLDENKCSIKCPICSRSLGQFGS